MYAWSDTQLRSKKQEWWENCGYSSKSDQDFGSLERIKQLKTSKKEEKVSNPVEAFSK